MCVRFSPARLVWDAEHSENEDNALESSKLEEEYPDEAELSKKNRELDLRVKLLAKESAQTHYSRGLLAEFRNDPEKALEYYQNAVRLDPENLEYKKALQACQESLDAQKNKPTNNPS